MISSVGFESPTMRLNLHFAESYLPYLNLSYYGISSWCNRHWRGWLSASGQTQRRWKTQRWQWCPGWSLSSHTSPPCTTSLPLTDTCMSERDPELQVDISVWKSSPLKVWVNIQVIDMWNSTRGECLDQLQEARQGQCKRNGITSQNSGSKVGKEGSIDHGENLVLMAQCLHLPPYPLAKLIPERLRTISI